LGKLNHVFLISIATFNVGKQMKKASVQHNVVVPICESDQDEMNRINANYFMKNPVNAPNSPSDDCNPFDSDDSSVYDSDFGDDGLASVSSQRSLGSVMAKLNLGSGSAKNQVAGEVALATVVSTVPVSLVNPRSDLRLVHLPRLHPLLRNAVIAQPRYAKLPPVEEPALSTASTSLAKPASKVLPWPAQHLGMQGLGLRRREHHIY